MKTVTKKEAVKLVEYGWQASHPQTKGSIGRQFGSREPKFSGDCSPKTGWVIEYLGER